jgi:hypothetical protein
MSRSAHVLAAMWAALFGKPRRATRPTLHLEALSERIVPTPMYYPIALDRGTDEFLSSLTSPASLANFRNHDSILLSSPSLFLHKTLNLVGNDGVTYGRVTFSQATANSDGSYSLMGTFTSGTLLIAVTGHVDPYSYVGSGTFTANFSFVGINLDPNGSGGFSATFHGVLSQTNQHASASGQLQVCVSNNLIGCVLNQPYTHVSGNWF